MKKTLRLALILLSVFILFSCESTKSKFDDKIALTIIHINDRHGRMGADAQISQLAKNTRGDVLIFDAGDSVHGQLTANLSTGESMVTLMNAVGYDVMTAGNHEFNFGSERLIELSQMMDFPLLIANVRHETLGEVFTPYKVFPTRHFKVGVFGLSTPDTATSTDPRNIEGYIFDDICVTAEAMVTTLRSQGCDLIVAVAHLGNAHGRGVENESKTLAENVNGIDIIIDGHSHTVLPEGLWVSGTLIAQTGCYGENIGIVEVTKEDGIVSKTAYLKNVETGGLPVDNSIVTLIAELDAATDDIKHRVVGYTPYLLNGERQYVRTGDTNLANLMTDAMRINTNADIAMLNGGCIRTSIPAGDITLGHILEVMPFSNIIMTTELTGQVIWEAVEHGVSVYPAQDGRFSQISGMFVEFDHDAEVGSRIISVKLPDETPIDPSQTYTVSMVEFMYFGGDGYTMFSSGTNVIHYDDDVGMFIRYLQTNPQINEEAEIRMKAVVNH